MEDLKTRMLTAYLDWYIDNPSDKELKAKFFELQNEYKLAKQYGDV